MLSLPAMEKVDYLERLIVPGRVKVGYLEGRKSVTWKGESWLLGRDKVGYLEGRKSVTWKG